jgi:NAD(P)-dependent dehydrogenase (short-subunit alcohol dehydrogenase family)
MSLDRWQTTINTNLTSSFLVAREYLRNLKLASPDSKEVAAMVLIGSTAGKYGNALFMYALKVPEANS